jgi:hypothetical protein
VRDHHRSSVSFVSCSGERAVLTAAQGDIVPLRKRSTYQVSLSYLSFLLTDPRLTAAVPSVCRARSGESGASLPSSALSWAV